MVFLNAGLIQRGFFAGTSNEDLEKIVRTNALHPIYLVKILLDRMYKRTKKSAIVFTSSVSGLMPMPGLATYSATKALVRYMSTALKVELKNRIDVLNYAPGFVATKMLT